MFRQIVNFLYRNPRSYIKRVNRFGGPVNYFLVQSGRKKMEASSHQLPPVSFFNDGLPLYFLTGKNFLYQTLYCIHSLLKHSSEKFCLYLVDDGSFDKALTERVKRQLPGAIILPAAATALSFAGQFPEAQYPALHRKRKEYPHIKKLTDIHTHIAGPGWKVVLDADMLFWHRPDEFINWLKNPDKPLHMWDCKQSYGYPFEKLEAMTGQSLKTQVNVGIIGLKSSDIDWMALEQWIVALEKEYGRSYFLEQALSAMLIGGKPSVCLSQENYIVNPSAEAITGKQGILHHYVDLSKEGYFKKAWKQLN